VDQVVVWWAFMMGVASHLMADALTKEGVPFFFPIPIKLGFPPIKFLRITTGEWVEKLVFVGLIFLNGWLIHSYADKFIGLLRMVTK
jgi:membrane-bound metal-dependent hydrolase YbcI (DUF457 family)